MLMLRRRWLLHGCLAALLTLAAAAQTALRGLPFIRTYALDDIGNVPRGLRLGFDRFGRVAVMYDGIYTVLNDAVWVDRINFASAANVRMTSIRFAAGHYYYGSRGSWGMVEIAADGTFNPVPLVPADAPEWTKVTPFSKLFGTARGMNFYEFGGLVHWDFAQRRNVFFEISRVSTAFALGERIFASSQDGRLRELDPDTGAARVLDVPGVDGHVISYSAPLADGQVLLASRDGDLMVFDGATARPWAHAEPALKSNGAIAAVERLLEGGVAIAVAGEGLFLYAADGSLNWVLNLPEFERIGALAAGEPGVIWVAGENAIHRVYYDSPLTSFGRALGVAAVWPYVAARHGQPYICSNGTLLAAVPPSAGQPARFRVLVDARRHRADSIAARGDHLLVGNERGVFAVDEAGNTQEVLTLANIAGLAFVDDSTCIVLGGEETTAIRFADGTWQECVPRIPGVGNAPIRLTEAQSLWVEMGGARVAKVTLRDDRLTMDRMQLPWDGEQWINVGKIGTTIILSGVSGRRAFFDESRQAFCEAREVAALLERSPYWILRADEDENGVIWGTHVQGVVTFTPGEKGYEVDATSFLLRNDSYPTVQILAGGDKWITAGRSLYHVEPHALKSRRAPTTALVSMLADDQNLELLGEGKMPTAPLRFSYEDNSLSFQVFSGSYAWLSPPTYEFRLTQTGSWTPVDPSLVLRLPSLRDGAYALQVRPTGPRAQPDPALSIPFEIEPPWYRTSWSYLVYALALLLAVGGVTRWVNRRSLRRNIMLERLVQARTDELEEAMDRLGEEIRKAATFAERSRLAGELHDSLQQGLSGAILHLDTTMRNTSITPDVYSHLNVARGMLSYSREEVQQAVWDLESPLLQNASLGEAIKKIASYIDAGVTNLHISAATESVSLSATKQHHLLRIAQEAITNAVKHAEATAIHVDLESSAADVILRIRDDGKGFEVSTRTVEAGHFGLRGLRNRVRDIGGRVEIASAPRQGTTVTVVVPLDPAISYAT